MVLQTVLDEGRVGLLLVLPQEDRIEAEDGLGLTRRDERVPIFPTKDRVALAIGVYHTAALRELPVGFLVQRALRLTEVAA